MNSEEIGAALSHLPTRAHRAFFRLLLDAVVSRRHLRNTEPSGWPSFVALGPTKTGKSLTALGACRVFGLDKDRTIRSVPAETERSFWGRRYQVPGGAWELRPAPVLAYSFLVLDELDKAPVTTQRACLKLLQGETRVPGEDGRLVEVAPTVLVLSNATANALPPEYRRRSIVLNTTTLAGQLDELGSVARNFLEALPVLDLDGLDVPRRPVPEQLLDELAKALRAGLSEDGWRMADERALGHVVAGRVALSGLDLRSAALAVVADYLDVAETVNETPTAPGPIAPAPAAAERRKAAAEVAARERERRQRERAEAVTLAGMKSEIVNELEGLRPDPAKYGSQAAAAARVAGQVDELIEMVEAAFSLAEVEEVIEDAGAMGIAEAIAELGTHRAAELARGEEIDADESEVFWRCQDCGERFAESECDHQDENVSCPFCDSYYVIEAPLPLRSEESESPPALPPSVDEYWRRYYERNHEEAVRLALARSAARASAWTTRTLF